MLLKCCTQCASKCEKLSSGHRTGKVVFTTIPKKGNFKECSTTTQLHSPLFIFFFLSLFTSVISTTLSSGPLLCFSLLSNLLLIPYSVSLLLSIRLFTYVWFFFIFSHFIIIFKLLTLFIQTYPEFFEHLYDHYLEFSNTEIAYLCFTYLFFSSLSCSLLGTCSFVTSFCLICCFYLCVFSRLSISLDLGKVAFYRRCHMLPSSALCSGHPEH